MDSDSIIFRISEYLNCTWTEEPSSSPYDILRGFSWFFRFFFPIFVFFSNIVWCCILCSLSEKWSNSLTLLIEVEEASNQSKEKLRKPTTRFDLGIFFFSLKDSIFPFCNCICVVHCVSEASRVGRIQFLLFLGCLFLASPRNGNFNCFPFSTLEDGFFLAYSTAKILFWIYIEKEIQEEPILCPGNPLFFFKMLLCLYKITFKNPEKSLFLFSDLLECCLIS